MTATLTDHDALLAAIIADPADDLLRLVFADWLEEDGQDERARFVRTQIDLHNVLIAISALGACHCGDSGDPTGCGRCREGERKGYWRARIRLREMESALLASFLPVPHGHPPRPFGVRIQGRYAFAGPAANLDDPDEQGWTFCRGFVESVHCTLAAWQEHGRAIAAAHPVEEVSLTDRQPVRMGRGRVAWHSGAGAPLAGEEPGTVGREVFVLLSSPVRDDAWSYYDSPELARTDLSRVLILLARRQAP